MAGNTLIVLFNLRDGQSVAAYEKWAGETDIPIAGSLKAVEDFKIYRAEGILRSDTPAPYRYIEILNIAGVDELIADSGNEPRMKDVVAAFRGFANDPIFMVTECIAG